MMKQKRILKESAENKQVILFTCQGREKALLSADAIKSLLPTDFSGDLIVLETTESTNQDAAKIVKKSTIKITEIVERIRLLSLNLFVRNSGIVIESPKAIVHLRKGFATINQFK